MTRRFRDGVAAGLRHPATDVLVLLLAMQPIAGVLKQAPLLGLPRGPATAVGMLVGMLALVGVLAVYRVLRESVLSWVVEADLLDARATLDWAAVRFSTFAMAFIAFAPLVLTPFGGTDVPVPEWIEGWVNAVVVVALDAVIRRLFDRLDETDEEGTAAGAERGGPA